MSAAIGVAGAACSYRSTYLLLWGGFRPAINRRSAETDPANRRKVVLMHP